MKGNTIKNLFSRGVVGVVFAFALMISGAFDARAIELGLEQDLAVKNYIDDSDTTIKARFNGHIPFVELSSLYHLLFDDEITINLIESDIYEVITDSGKATINTANDSLYSDNYSKFIAPPDSDDSGDDSNIPKMIKGMDYQTKGAVSPTSIDFTKYNVDLYSENGKIWLPASAGLNIFMQMGFYDGNILNIIDSKNTEISSTAEYKAKLQNLFSNKQRFSEYAKEAYNGLCFVFDVFYGHPERNQLSESIANSGLDATLKNYNDETRLIRNWLLSDNLVEYYAGLAGLDAALYDGGHTNLVDNFRYDFLLEAYPGLTNNESYELYKDLEFYKNKSLDYFIRITKISNARRNALGTEKYTEKGDIAIYSFDEFNFDALGWNRYYENGGEYPGDTLGGVLEALDKALENPNIKYFVFDVSNNSGGMALVAPMIMNYLGYDNILHEKNTITGQIEEIGLKIDTNRDGVYDEKDRISKYHFNYGVLASDFTFSTGNLFVAMAKDNNFAILGERSGGGACNITTYNTSEGVMYTMSATSCSQNKYGESVDLGTIPDYDLIQMIDGEKNYDKFYNLDILSSLLNDFYKTEENDSTEPSNTANIKNKRKTLQSDVQDELPLTDDILEENATPKKPAKTEPEKHVKEPEEVPENNVVVYIIVSTVAATGAIGIGLYIKKVR